MFVAVLLLILGFILLIKGGDWFVDGASGIVHRFHVPEIIIGATVVSIGTTLPEVMVSATGALAGQGAIAYGNAIGSIICNTSLIAALTIAIRPAPVNKGAIRMPVIFFFLSAAVYLLSAYLLGYFYWWVGVILLCLFVVYMFMTIRQGLKNPDTAAAEEEEEEKKEDFVSKLLKKILPESAASMVKDILLLVVGAALIAWGADLLVDNATFIAESLGVPQTVIALTIVALGTSLPELVTAITSLIKGHGALSLGNIIGANIFNLVLVSGVSVTLSPFPVPFESTLGGMNASLVLDLPIMVAVMALMTLPALFKGKLAKWQGFALLAIYAAFLVVQFLFVQPM